MPFYSSPVDSSPVVFARQEEGAHDGMEKGKKTLSFSPFPSCLRAPSSFRVKTTGDESPSPMCLEQEGYLNLNSVNCLKRTPKGLS